MKQVSYQQRRERIKTGDLLVWKKDQQSKLSNLFLKVVRTATLSEFAHVGIALRIGKRLFVVEATIPKVRIAPVSCKDEFYHIPMGVSPNEADIDFLLDAVGLDYSLIDAIRAYLGHRLKDRNRYQCVELAMEFYKRLKVDVDCDATPAEFVNHVLMLNETSITLVKK